jgi:hypothetical protein
MSDGSLQHRLDEQCRGRARRRSARAGRIRRRGGGARPRQASRRCSAGTTRGDLFAARNDDAVHTSWQRGAHDLRGTSGHLPRLSVRAREGRGHLRHTAPRRRASRPTASSGGRWAGPTCARERARPGAGRTSIRSFGNSGHALMSGRRQPGARAQVRHAPRRCQGGMSFGEPQASDSDLFLARTTAFLSRASSTRASHRKLSPTRREHAFCTVAAGKFRAHCRRRPRHRSTTRGYGANERHSTRFDRCLRQRDGAPQIRMGSVPRNRRINPRSSSGWWRAAAEATTSRRDAIR